MINLQDVSGNDVALDFAGIFENKGAIKPRVPLRFYLDTQSSVFYPSIYDRLNFAVQACSIGTFSDTFR